MLRRGFASDPVTLRRTRFCRAARDNVRLKAINVLARRGSRRSLAGLATDDLIRILDAFYLVRLGRTQLTNLCGDRSEELPIRGFRSDEDLTLDLGGHTRRKLIHDRMRIAERKIDVG